MIKGYRKWCVLLVSALALTNSRSFPSEGFTQKGEGPKDAGPEHHSVQQLLSNNQIDDVEAARLIFEEGNEAVPSLVTALQKGIKLERASRALAYLGTPEDRKVLRKLIGAQKDLEKKWIMASFLAGALVEPRTEEEWEFLESCVRGYEDDSKSFASFSAVLALGINASTRALRLLHSIEFPKQGTHSENDTVEEATQAIRWINQRSQPKTAGSAESGSDLEQIKQTILREAFFSGGKSEDVLVEQLVFTKDRTRALAALEVRGGSANPHGYGVVLEKSLGLWRITGAWFSWAA